MHGALVTLAMNEGVFSYLRLKFLYFLGREVKHENIPLLTESRRERGGKTAK